MFMSDQASLPSQVVALIRNVVGEGPVALHEPRFVGNEWLYLKECLDSTFVSSVGKFVERFENDLSKFTGAKYAIAVVNGTAALHVALKLSGVQPTDEVMIPALTFIATANAVSYCNAVPHFVDSEIGTLGVSAIKLRDYLINQTEQRSGLCINRNTGRVIRALVPMHTFGHPVDMDGLLAVARDFNIVLVEDAAESLGSCYHGKHTGTLGLMGALSFNGNKTITTGGGGALLTNDPELARHAKHITTTAKLKHAWEFSHDEIGYNYRLPNLNAALGCAQLEQLPAMLSAKRVLYKRYQDAFARVAGISLIAEPSGCYSNYWLQTLLLETENIPLRDSILSATNDAGFMTRPAWKLMSDLIPFKGFPQMDLTVAKSLEKRLINIPSSSNLIVDKA
jgi:perosamine synthetase